MMKQQTNWSFKVCLRGMTIACCSVLQCVCLRGITIACCSVLQCVCLRGMTIACCSVLQCVCLRGITIACCSVLQCVCLRGITIALRTCIGTLSDAPPSLLTSLRCITIFAYLDKDSCRWIVISWLIWSYHNDVFCITCQLCVATHCVSV